MRALLEDGVDADPKGVDGYTALMSASEAGHIGVVKILLAHGVDVNKQRRGHYSDALDAAISEGHIDVMKALLEKGAWANSRDIDMGTPLMKASRQRNLDAVRVLLEHGARVNEKDGKGNTALWHAIFGTLSRDGDGPGVVRA